MRLLIVGTLRGQLTIAAKMAMDKGVAVTHAETIEQAMAVVRGRGADLMMVEVALDIRDLVQRLEAEQLRVPIVACGVDNNLVGCTVAEVERDLILETLKHCLGNRTHAANILGISIRTLRNKLNEYSSDGVPIPPPGGGEMQGAA